MRKKPPTMADVARLAGVSPMTVSRALRPEASASEKTRKKILNAADQLGYILDSTAAGLSSRKTGFVAVTFPSINNANFALTLSALTEGLHRHGLEILLGYTDYDLLEEERVVEALLRRRPEAIVVTGGLHTERCRRYLHASGVPVIEIWDLPSSPIEHVVGFSNEKTGRMMARHLFEKGYRKLSFIGGDTQLDIRGSGRRMGFTEAMEELGLDTSRLWVSDEVILTMDVGAQAMDKLLQKFPDTDAVVCVSDPSAFGALMTCRRYGLDIPDDIAVAGFGAYDVSENCYPQITTIDVNSTQIGTEAANIIIDELVLKSPNKESRQIIVPTTLLPRESTQKTK